jgi:hypothetical protein
VTTALTRPVAAAAARRGRHEQPPGPPRRRWEALAYLLLGAALAGAVLLPGRGQPSVDTSPRLYFQPARTLTGAFSTWSPAPTLGQQSYDAGIAPVAAAVWAVHALARSVWLTTRLWRLLLLLAAAGAARLYHRVTTFAYYQDHVIPAGDQVARHGNARASLGVVC